MTINLTDKEKEFLREEALEKTLNSWKNRDLIINELFVQISNRADELLNGYKGKGQEITDDIIGKVRNQICEEFDISK